MELVNYLTQKIIARNRSRPEAESRTGSDKIQDFKVTDFSSLNSDRQLVEKRLTDFLSRPRSLGEYISFCQYDPEVGYYPLARPMTSEGENSERAFITFATESPLLPHVLGYSIKQSLDKVEDPIIEVYGDGDGSLSNQLWRQIAKLNSNPTMRLYELSPSLADLQAKKFEHEVHEGQVEVIQADALSATGRVNVVVSLEWLDALPAEVFMRTSDRSIKQVFLRLNTQTQNIESYWDNPYDEDALTYLNTYAKHVTEKPILHQPQTALGLKKIAQRLEPGGTMIMIDYFTNKWLNPGDDVGLLFRGQERHFNSASRSNRIMQGTGLSNLQYAAVADVTVRVPVTPLIECLSSFGQVVFEPTVAYFSRYKDEAKPKGYNGDKVFDSELRKQLGAKQFQVLSLVKS